MKGIVGIVIGFLLLVSCVVYAQTTYVAYQVTLGWDEALLTSGDPVPEGYTVKYKGWMMLTSDGAISEEIGETEELELKVTFTTPGKYYLGVSSHMYNAKGILVSKSEPCWSNVPVCVFNGETFDVSYIAISPAKNLRLKE